MWIWISSTDLKSIQALLSLIFSFCEKKTFRACWSDRREFKFQLLSNISGWQSPPIAIPEGNHRLWQQIQCPSSCHCPLESALWHSFGWSDSQWQVATDTRCFRVECSCCLPLLAHLKKKGCHYCCTDSVLVSICFKMLCKFWVLISHWRLFLFSLAALHIKI